MTMLIFTLGSYPDSILSAIIILTSVANIITGIMFCFSEGERYAEPVTDNGGFGIHTDDYIQRHIYHMIDVTRIRKLQKTYIRESGIALQIQKWTIAIGLVFLILVVIS